MILNRSIIIFLIALISSCSNTNTMNDSCETHQEAVSIDFILSKDFDNAMLSIDGIEFKHSYYLDSINNGNYLPKEKIIFFTIENRNAEETTTKISLATILARKLKRTGNYSILNGPQILTQGVLKFKRKDGKKVLVTNSKKYPAYINEMFCN